MCYAKQWYIYTTALTINEKCCNSYVTALTTTEQSKPSLQQGAIAK